ncbi:hypothetical protein MVEN_00125600 [Mycena venus]|uniref:Uncharacterized protein n=1 Tax=Mycena venus TaxID=2733690 RepID=A0A8H7DFN3_9AGAR|nr:hypothetical protein MVEN_00125600 [Mycena venus]
MPNPKAAQANNWISAMSMSSKIHVTTMRRSQSGCVLKERKSLTASKVHLAKAEEARREAERLEAMTAAQRHNLDLLHDFGDAFNNDDRYEQDVLHGHTTVDISHTGKALPSDDADAADTADTELMAGLRVSLCIASALHSCLPSMIQATQQIDAFEAQLERMTDAYLEFSLANVDEGLVASTKIPESAEVQETRDLLVVDVFLASHQSLMMIGGDTYIASTCVRQGWMPCAAYFPTVAITIRALEAFVRALCDIHGVAPHPWLGAQFSVAFNVYLAVRARVDKRVEVALGWDAPDWRLKNACPACLYTLEGEPHLKYPFMCTFDGNNSLSRFWAREREESLADGITAPGASKELQDDRVAPGDYYLFSPDTEDGEEDSGCSERWQNMKEDVTARAYGMYDETSFFPALCRHGFILKVVDMVKSGELSKYPLAITAHLLNILGEIAIGYDIGFGAFHGHGHGRLCGLDNLMTYVEGVGLEALEICDRFHRQQAITTYLKHADTFETYQGLSLLLCSKYRRALEIKATEATLHATMQELGVESRETLSKEPAEETLEMEYYQKLVNLREAEERIAAIRGIQMPFVPAEMDASYTEAAKATWRIEMQRRHALELQTKALAAAMDLELHLGIAMCWTPGDEKWEAVAAMVGRCRYQRALDHLQGLIIVWMFELAKCNMSGTGYKLCKHIVKSLQAWSKAVKTTIARYNEVAEAMMPPKPMLEWEEVIEYTFLADFDLLREGREDIRGEPWAQPAGRAAMDQHYKLLRTNEEIRRLNVEIRCFVTYMRDEEAFLSCEEGCLEEEGRPEIAHQVRLVRMEHAHFTVLHTSHLLKLSKVPGCTADIVPGTSISREILWIFLGLERMS